MTQSSLTTSSLTTSLINLFNKGGPYTEQQLTEVYNKEIRFTDPAHSIAGIAELCEYLNHQYSNIQHCKFNATGEWACDNNLFLQWDMELQHPKLNRGKTIVVNGLSHLQCVSEKDESIRIVMHRDFFDLGQLLYENVPLLGAINRRLKRGMSS